MKARQYSLLILGGLFILLSALGCGPATPPYLAQKTFYEGKWEVSDSLKFNIAHSGEGVSFLNIDLQMGPNFPFRNIFLKCGYTGPDGQSDFFLIQDTLMDALGNWNVEFSGDRILWEIQPSPQLMFTQPGTYECWLTQYMRADPLKEVYQVGLWVDP